MTCTGCGAETHPNQKFCSECGESLARACETCGRPYEGSPKFCAECGAKLTNGSGEGLLTLAGPVAPSHAVLGEPAAWEAQAGGAERKQVSILFADLVGFTTMSERRDAEEVREQLTEYFQIASDVIARYGGTVEKFIGDAVMAVWGTPVAHEDDAERAVRAALELVEAVKGMNRSDDEINLRAGVLTGEAAVTLGATNQGMVAGDLVNTASRLQSIAPPGTVLVGETTYRTAARAIVFEAVGEQELKGKASPVPAYRAVRVVAQRGGVGRADQLEAPFLGRDPELRMVKELFHATQRERRPRLLSIMGQGGIGKSRLTWEFVKYIDGIKDRVQWHQGRSPAYGEGITFWALGEMVRSRVGLLETDDQATTRAKIADSLATHVPDEAERRWMAPKIEQLLGIGDTETGGREELFAAWRTFFERVAGDNSAILVFEDLHWADSGLLDFIEHLLTWARSAPIYIITLSRPELLEKRPTWGAGQRNFTNLTLEPLPDPVIRAILDSLVPGIPEAVAGQITTKAEGIPLYAVETVRMLLQDGRLTSSDGGFQLVGDISDLAVPATLQSLIAARLDALDAIDRSLLQQASVLGQTFTLPALSAISGERDGLADRLMSLVRRELLTMDADPRSPERGQYGFVQALVRDVAYNTLSKRDRKVVHLAAGEYYESLGDDEIVDATAMHFLDAYRSAPEDPDADAARKHAAELLQQAASRATLLGSHDQAVRFLELALEVTADAGERVRILGGAGTAAMSAGRYEIAEGYLRRASEAAQAAGDLSAEARAVTDLGRVIASAGRPSEAVAELAAALDRFAALAGGPEVVRLHAALARGHMLKGDFSDAIEWADQALPHAERLDLVFEIADLLITRATALTSWGRVREGLAELQGSLLLAESYGLAWLATRARVNLIGTLALEDPEAALRLGQAGMEDARRTGARDMIATIAVNVAGVAMTQGRFDLAGSVLEEVLASDPDPSDRFVAESVIVIHRAILGEPYQAMLDDLSAYAASRSEAGDDAQVDVARSWADLITGRFAEANEASMRSVAVKGMSDSEVLPVAARAALWGGLPDKARQAKSTLQESGSHGRTIDAWERGITAGMAAQDGRLDEAADAYRDVIRQLRDLGSRFELALTELDFVRFVGGERPEVLAAAEEARAIFTEIGAKPLLRRLDETLGIPVD